MIGRVGAVRRAVGIRGTDRAAGNVTLVKIRFVAELLPTQQLLQESRVLVPDVRRHGRDGTRGIATAAAAAAAATAAAIVGTVMVRQKLAYSVHFTRDARDETTTHVSTTTVPVYRCGRGDGRSIPIGLSNLQRVTSRKLFRYAKAATAAAAAAAAVFFGRETRQR